MRLKFEAPGSKLRSSGVGNRRKRSLGFTLIEMVVVISMILILLAIALPMYSTAIQRSREARLHQDIATLNKAIQEFSLDKKKAPQSLQDLVPGYIKFIPTDITGSTETWQTEQEDSEDAYDANELGIKSVHSGSDGTSIDGGVPYSSWTR
jgi:general secretion pathway protein G